MSGIELDHIAMAAERLSDGPPVTGDASRCGSRAGTMSSCIGISRRGGPGIHHVTFRVPSLAEVCARAVDQGYRIVGYDDSNPSWSEAFLHPKEALGIVVQFAESRVPATPRPWSPPPGPPDPPPPVAVVGLQMSARSVERADTQWAGILEAERSASERAVDLVDTPVPGLGAVFRRSRP